MDFLEATDFEMHPVTQGTSPGQTGTTLFLGPSGSTEHGNHDTEEASQSGNKFVEKLKPFKKHVFLFVVS